MTPSPPNCGRRKRKDDRALSFGGGVQSTALLVLAARNEINFSLAAFANVGADSENPETLTYIAEHSRPYAAAHGIEFVEVQKHRRTGEPDTIIQWLARTERSIGIPMRMANGAPGNRSCTEQFKVHVIRKELKARGANATNPATVALGISTDEWQRMRSDSGDPAIRNAYPLFDLGISRADCLTIIADAGLPLPPKSSCWFCPYKRLPDWRKMRRVDPALFAAAEALEQRINERRAKLGKDPVYLSSRAVPLADAVGTHDQLDLFEDATCDIAGYCHV